VVVRPHGSHAAGKDQTENDFPGKCRKSCVACGWLAIISLLLDDRELASLDQGRHFLDCATDECAAVAPCSLRANIPLAVRTEPMNRRTFVSGLGALLAAPRAAEPQQAGRSWKIGFLGPSPSGTAPHLAQAFRHGLRELGYVEGTNISIEFRSTEPGDYERYRPLAAELVSLTVDVLVTSITPAALAAKKATTTTPIVMVNVDDPVESGLVASLSRPGGNITGLSRMTPEIVSKGLAPSQHCVLLSIRNSSTEATDEDRRKTTRGA
jgi:hypothetical protein